MTPAIKEIQQKKIPYKLHEYEHDPSASSYGMEAAEKIGVAAEKVFKTLVVELDAKELAVGIIPVNEQLNMKQMAKAAGGKKAVMADGQKVQKSSGYVLGGVSPVGQKKRLKTILNESAMQHDTVFVSAGKRGLDVELTPDDLLKLTGGKTAQLCNQ